MASKNEILTEIQDFLLQRKGWNTEQSINDDLVKSIKEIKGHSLDELSICTYESEGHGVMGGLTSFNDLMNLESYTEKVFEKNIELFCNLLESYKDKSETAHKHRFDSSVGKYYRLYHSSLGYRFDRVLIFERKQCFCGEYKDFEISRNDCRPSSLFKKDSETKEFIENIKKKGIEEEFEINLRTNVHAMNIEKV